MLRTNLSVIDYLVFVSLLMSSTLIGLYFWHKSRSNASAGQFLTGRHELSMFPVMMSLMASFTSTSTLLGTPAEVYQLGTQLTVYVFGYVIAVCLAAQVFLPIYYRLELFSINQYLFMRFNAEYIRLTGTVGFIIATVPYMAVVLYGPALALSSVTSLSITTSILVIGIICTFYTSFGGIKAVIWTDVLQFTLMLLGLLMVIIQGISSIGLREIWRINEQGGRIHFFNMNLDIYNKENFWNIIISSIIVQSSYYCCLQTQVQRYCSLESIQKARRVSGLIMIWLMAVICGTVLYAKYHDCDPVSLKLIERYDQLMPYYVLDTLSKYPGLSGLFIACVFSGSLSTLSSGLNALAVITWEDIVKNRINYTDDKKAIDLTKLIAIIYGLLTIGLAFIVGNVGTVLQATIALVGSIVGPLFALFIIAILYPYANAPGSLLGFISGISVSLFLSIGSIIYTKHDFSIGTTADNCPIELNSYINTEYNYSLANFTANHSDDNTKSLSKLFGISYLLLPAIGFIICLTVGAISSLCIGKPIEVIDDNLMTPLSKQIFTKFYNQRPKERANESETLDVSV